MRERERDGPFKKVMLSFLLWSRTGKSLHLDKEKGGGGRCVFISFEMLEMRGKHHYYNYFQSPVGSTYNICPWGALI